MKRVLYVFTGLCLLAGVFTGCEKPEKQSVIEDMNIELVYVEGGTFEMGATSEQKDDAWDDEKPMHTVTLSSFYIGKYEVTQGQWKAVMGMTLKEQADKAASYSDFVAGWLEEYGLNGEGNKYPIYYVSWEDAQEFCRRLSETTGKNYVLPTEAQWEYAARGGNRSQHYKYAGSNDIDEVAWYDGNSGNKTHPVGTKKPNELGIYDMSGNVYEWCSDWYGSYSSSPAVNPQGPSNGSDRVFRGGTWYNASYAGRVSHRSETYSDSRDLGLGFRVACISE